MIKCVATVINRRVQVSYIVRGERKVDSLCSPVSSRDYKLESRNRSIRIIRRLLSCNSFDYFVTFTIGNNVVSSRYDLNDCKAMLSCIMESLKGDVGRFRYVLVPDKHKDGSWHFHGVVSFPKSALRRCGNFRFHGKWYPKYLCPQLLAFGRNEFRPIISKSVSSMQSYVLKYISKTESLPSYQYYMRSRNLVLDNGKFEFEGSEALDLVSVLDSAPVKRLYLPFCDLYFVSLDLWQDVCNKAFIKRFEGVPLAPPKQLSLFSYKPPLSLLASAI